MRILLALLIMLSAATMQAQLPVITDSALVKLVQGNVTWLTRMDSIKAYMNVGAGSDGNGIYSGSGTVPSGAVATVTDNLTARISTATNSAVVKPLVIDGRVTGAGGGAAGFGTGIVFTAESATVENREIFEIAPSWTSSSDATRTASVGFLLPSSGTYATRITLNPTNLTTPGAFTFGNSTGDVTLGGSSGRAVLSSSANAADAILLLPTSATTGSANGITLLGSSTATNTSGSRIGVTTSGSFAPTSGTANYSAQEITTTYNQTGGANGITRALHINPNVQAAPNFRALDIAHNNTNTHAIHQGGANVLNFLNGNTGIGIAPGNKKLYVAGDTRFDLGSDSTGDVYYRNSIGNFTRLGIGTNGQVLSSNGTIPAWTTPSAGGGIDTLNTLTASNQTFATGTTGTNFNISSTGSTHTFNIPSASATNRGLVTTGTQFFSGAKSFREPVTIGALDEFSGAVSLVGAAVGSVVTISAADITGNWNMLLPQNDGNVNEFLITDGSGVTTWDAIDSTVITNGAISVRDIGQHGASSGQVLKWNGTQWAAAADDTGSAGGGIYTGSDTIPAFTVATVTDNFSIAYETANSAIEIDDTGGELRLYDKTGNTQALLSTDSIGLVTNKLTVVADTFDISQVAVKIGFPSGGGGAGVEAPSPENIENSAFTALMSIINQVDCSGGAITVTPPIGAAINDRFAVVDATADAATNNITIDFDTANQKLYGVEQNYIINAAGGYVEFIYMGATTGWVATKG